MNVPISVVSPRPKVPSSWKPCDLLREAHAARAVDAAGHVGGDERAEVLVLHDALALGVARDVAPEAHREILQLALAALVADRAVERMIDQQELHRRALRGDGRGDCVKTFMPSATGVAQAGIGFGAFSTLDEAHAAVGRDRQLLVVAEARHVDVARDPSTWISISPLRAFSGTPLTSMCTTSVLIVAALMPHSRRHPLAAVRACTC